MGYELMNYKMSPNDLFSQIQSCNSESGLAQEPNLNPSKHQSNLRLCSKETVNDKFYQHMKHGYCKRTYMGQALATSMTKTTLDIEQFLSLV